MALAGGVSCEQRDGKGQAAVMAGLLFVSGACALAYQTVWLREFRLVFGGATPAAAAVLAVFMGGLGWGGAWWGRRAERSPDVLRLYAGLELGIGLSAAATPWVLEWVRRGYVATGGVLTLGVTGALVAQLLLAAVVLWIPCALMGGTLPPAVRWATQDRDRARGALGLVYGFNALGAVVGVSATTFWALERWGSRGTVLLAAVLNLALGGIAWWWAARRRGLAPAGGTERDTRGEDGNPEQGRVGVGSANGAMAGGISPRVGYWVAGWTGLLFFLAELTWFRMLTPLLGGTAYGFGLILAEVLLGIGLGGAMYRWVWGRGERRVRPEGLAVLLVVQALVAAVPWALGDRLAVMAYHWQQARAFGFAGLVTGWVLTAGGVVFLPSLVAGIQFPWLLSLLGEGRAGVGRQVGTAYAANTAGAIAGSLAGGFVLMPWLTAPGCWQAMLAATVMLGFAVLVVSERPWHPGAVGVVLAGGTLALGLAFRTTGPTAGWRQTSIGYGVVRGLPERPAELEDALRRQRRGLAREYEGRESNIAVMASDDGWGLFVNGKADGSALNDLGTQVMLGMIGAVLHPDPRSAFVIGMGTGATGGWLAAVPGMERVDVAELEPRVVDVAGEFFAPMNQGALGRTNLQVLRGDAREILLASDRRYDLIVSEPSNPYRAGVAGLFTREYYAAVRSRLNEGGIFSQWLQGYQLTVESLQLVYATLGAEFPHVETWLTQANDLVFVCHGRAPEYPLARIRERLARAPFAEALRRAWLEEGAEGFLARHFAGPELARRVAAAAPGVNRDDRNLLEYGLARAMLSGATFQFRELLGFAVGAGQDQPGHLREVLDGDRLAEARMMFLATSGEAFEDPRGGTEDQAGRVRALRCWGQGNWSGVLQHWRGPATSTAQRLMLAISAGRAGTPEQAGAWVPGIAEDWPADAHLATAWAEHRRGNATGAAREVREAFEAMRRQPWVRQVSLGSVVELTAGIHASDPGTAETLLQAWTTPTSVGQLAVSAPVVWYRLAFRLPPATQVEVMRRIGPHHPWTREYLGFRLQALRRAGHPGAARADADFERYERQEGRLLVEMFGEPAPRD